MARTTDRLIDDGERPRRYGAWILLGVLILLGAGGFWLWRQGRLEPILTPAHNLIAKIESYFPGAEPETTPASTTPQGTASQDTASDTTASNGASSMARPPARRRLGAAPADAAMVQEIKQLLTKLDLSPGPIDGNLDQATQDAIRSYQEMAGEPVDGQPSRALLQDLRAVVADQKPAGWGFRPQAWTSSGTLQDITTFSVARPRPSIAVILLSPKAPMTRRSAPAFRAASSIERPRARDVSLSVLKVLDSHLMP